MPKGGESQKSSTVGIRSQRDRMALNRESWDVFIAHAGADVAAARALSAELTARRLTSFLDAARLRAGNGWPTRLKAALARSRVIAVLVSPHSDKAYYLQEEVAIAVALFRQRPSSIRVVPVLLRSATRMHLPYGTFTRHALYEKRGGWPAVARALVTLLKKLSPLKVSSAIGRSSQIVDEIWAGMEPALFDKKDPRRPRDFDMRYRSDGNDLIARDRDGHEVQRVTRKQLNERLTPDLLRHIEVLERAMEINKAIWDERHPRRVLERRSKRAAENAARAMSEDLAAVLNTIERAGMWLDDHYLDVREIVNQTKARRRS